MRDRAIVCSSHTPKQGLSLQPRHVPRPGIKPVTFWFTGWHSIHRATPGRACYWWFLILPSTLLLCHLDSCCQVKWFSRAGLSAYRGDMAPGGLWRTRGGALSTEGGTTPSGPLLSQESNSIAGPSDCSRAARSLDFFKC